MTVAPATKKLQREVFRRQDIGRSIDCVEVPDSMRTVSGERWPRSKYVDVVTEQAQKALLQTSGHRMLAVNRLFATRLNAPEKKHTPPPTLGAL